MSEISAMYFRFPIRFGVWLALFALPTLLALAQNPAPDSPAPSATPDAFFFRDGDSPVVFLGDSITEQRRYTTLIQTYVLTRFPAWNITFRNAGWAGDTAWLVKRGDFDTALQRDVSSLLPKVVLIDFGMNDARGGDASYSRYLDSMTKLVKGLEKAGARVVLLTPSPEEKYESGAPAGSAYNNMLKKYAEGVKIVSDNERVPIVDQFTPFVSFIDAGRKAGVLGTTDIPPDPNLARLIPDGVHPNWGGHLIMASIILEAMHAPAEVSSVTLDAAGHSILASSGCTVEWTGASNSIRFKRTDDVLPWPLPNDPTIDLALKIPGFDPAATLDHYETTVTGLTAPSYNLTIDGALVGTYTNAELAAGINLGFIRKGPIYDQMQQVLTTVLAKNDAYFERWRNVQLFQIPPWLAGVQGIQPAKDAELSRLDHVISDSEQSLVTLRKPVAHVFELDPVGAPK